MLHEKKELDKISHNCYMTKKFENPNVAQINEKEIVIYEEGEENDSLKTLKNSIDRIYPKNHKNPSNY